MITSNFTGNLGNHMWIYAITRAVAEKNGYKWGFNPVTEYDYYNGVPQIEFMDIDYGIKHSFSYNETPPWIKHIWKEKFQPMSFPNGDSIEYHPYQPDIFSVEDDTKLFVRCCQDARYLLPVKEDVKKWFAVKEDNVKLYNERLEKLGIVLDENLTVINIRGGEYKGVPSLILNMEYWWRAINHVLINRNHNMKFIVVTDDIEYAKAIMPQNMNIPVYHFGIGMDYYVINNAKNLILSNSSFAIFPAWLNNNYPYVIAPRYWARHNVSTGYWASTDIWTFDWLFLDGKDGRLYEK